MRFGTVILAAGASVRMGRPKLLLGWGDKTILAHLLEQWKELSATRIGVVVEGGSLVERECERLQADAIINPKPELGMWSSVQSAARWAGWDKEITHFAITLGDQPHVGVGTLRTILEFAARNAEGICQPARNGKGRHPVVLTRKTFAELAEAKEANLQEFLRAREPLRRRFESVDPALDLDIDTPADYEKALGYLH